MMPNYVLDIHYHYATFIRMLTSTIIEPATETAEVHEEKEKVNVFA